MDDVEIGSNGTENIGVDGLSKKLEEALSEHDSNEQSKLVIVLSILTQAQIEQASTHVESEERQHYDEFIAYCKGLREGLIESSGTITAKDLG